MLTKRPLMCLALSFVAGMYILSLLDFVSVALLSAFLILIFTLLIIKKISLKNTVVLLLSVVLFLSGSIRYSLADNTEKRELFQVVDKTVIFEAEIIEEPIISEMSVSFVGNVMSVTDGVKTYDCDEKVRFSKYIKTESDLYNFADLKIGDVVSSEGEITLPKGAMNFGGFDYAKYLKSDNIFFQVKITSSKIEVKNHINRTISHAFADFRKKCISFFDDAFPEKEASVLKAFITGDKSTISDELADSFSNSGLSHILAVSGLHVAVFISLIASLLKLFNISKRKEMFFCAVAAMFFVLFTGAPVSAIRAGMLAIFAFIAKLIYRKSDPLTTLSLAAAVLCLINPHLIYSASFMLSFAATAGILLFYNTISAFFGRIYKNIDSKSVRYKVLKNIFDSLAVGISAQILVTPLLVYLFYGFSLMSVVSTMLVTPFLSFLLAGGILFIAVSFVSTTIAVPVGGFIYLLAKLMIFISEYMGSFSFSRIIFGQITPFILLNYALFVAVLFFLIKKKKYAYRTALISLAILSCIGAYNAQINKNLAQVSFINVGQGDCALFKAPGDCDILFDCGGYQTSEETGEYIIAPYLIKNGVTDVEYVVISHMHKDHIIGLDGLLDILPIENLIIPYGQADTEDAKAILKKAEQNNVTITYFTAGDVIKINDNILITALAPDEKQAIIAEDENDAGIVARLDYGESSFLFTGDISSDIESYLLETYPDKIEADVLKVAHHGSKYSTSQKFVDAVDPEFAYIPVGENSYGHPAPQVISRLKRSGTEVLRADINKDVTFYFDSHEIKGLVHSK